MSRTKELKIKSLLHLHERRKDLMEQLDMVEVQLSGLRAEGIALETEEDASHQYTVREYKKKNFISDGIFEVNATPSIEGLPDTISSFADKNSFLTSVLNSISDVIMVKDIEHRFVYVNDAFYRFSGLTSTEVIGNTDAIFFPREVVEKFYAIDDRVFSTGREIIIEEEVPGKDNSITVFQTKKSLIRFDDGSSYLIGIIRDITESKLLEKALKYNENQLAAIVKALPDMIFLLTEEGVVLDLIAPKPQFLRYTPEYYLGRNVKQFGSSKLNDKFAKTMDMAFSTNRMQSVEYQFTVGGKLHWFEARFVPYGFDRILVIVRDIDTRKEIEQSLHLAKVKAESSDKLKNHLFANLNHEFRTPMNGILGFSEILMEKAQSKDIQNIASMIFASSTRLMSTLNTIVVLGQLESNSVKPVFERVNLTDELKELVKEFSSEITLKKLSLLTHFTHRISIRSDKHMLRELVNQLLSNAVKFTDEGFIEVSCGFENIDDMQIPYFSVRDTGIGVGEEDYDKIFEDFKQLSEGLGRRFEGVGIGLSVVKRIASRLSFEISLEKPEGQGIIFKIYLPKDIVLLNEEIIFTDDAIYQFNAPLKLDKKVNALIVEDNHSNNQLLAFILKEYADIQICENGYSAIKKCNEISFDVIFMDINLGYGMNGLDAAQEIWKEGLNKKTPIVAVTGYTDTLTRQSILKKKFSHYILKPYHQEKILEVLVSLFGN